jgi:predicted transglutaminase-like cysteine proteinase
MQWLSKTLRAAGYVLAGMTLLTTSAAVAASERPVFISIGGEAKAPIGWLQFCSDNLGECAAQSGGARDVVLNAKAWSDLVRINRWANNHVKPITDLEHWGVVERWDYPTDGYGDCEDYVLLKQQMLVKAGWPRSALLVTVVRDRKGDGHAVLTVKTDKGEFILDNQNESIVLWSGTGYRFVKRQSQFNPNAWVSLGDPPPATTTASAR